jgi:hypothetical protein
MSDQGTFKKIVFVKWNDHEAPPDISIAGIEDSIGAVERERYAFIVQRSGIKVHRSVFSVHRF